MFNIVKSMNKVKNVIIFTIVFSFTSCVPFPTETNLDGVSDSKVVNESDKKISEPEKQDSTSNENENENDYNNQEGESSHHEEEQDLNIWFTNTPQALTEEEIYSFSFEFVSNQEAAFECRLIILDDLLNECKDDIDNRVAQNCINTVCDGVWRSCTSPTEYSFLPDGQYLFEARALNSYGQERKLQYQFTIRRTVPCYVGKWGRSARINRLNVPEYTDEDGYIHRYSAVILWMQSITDTRFVDTSESKVEVDWQRLYIKYQTENGAKICLLDSERINMQNYYCYYDNETHSNSSGVCGGGFWDKKNWFATDEYEPIYGIDSEQEIVFMNNFNEPDKIWHWWGTKVFLPEHVNVVSIWPVARIRVSGPTLAMVGYDYYKTLTTPSDGGQSNNIEGAVSGWALSQNDFQIIYNADIVPDEWNPTELYDLCTFY